MSSIKRGDIFYADLETGKGSEQQGAIRPVMIIQNDVINKFGSTLIVAPITSKEKLSKENIMFPFHVILEKNHYLRCNSIVLLEQLKTIHSSKLREFMARASDETMLQVDSALSISVGLNKDYCTMDSHSIKRGNVVSLDIKCLDIEKKLESELFLIIQNDVGNKNSATLIVAPITCSGEPLLPIHAMIKTNFLKAASRVLLEQIITIDRTRIISIVGKLNDETMLQIDSALAISVGLNKDYCACA